MRPRRCPLRGPRAERARAVGRRCASGNGIILAPVGTTCSTDEISAPDGKPDRGARFEPSLPRYAADASAACVAAVRRLVDAAGTSLPSHHPQHRYVDVRAAGVGTPCRELLASWRDEDCFARRQAVVHRLPMDSRRCGAARYSPASRGARVVDAAGRGAAARTDPRMRSTAASIDRAPQPPPVAVWGLSLAAAHRGSCRARRSGCPCGRDGVEHVVEPITIRTASGRSADSPDDVLIADGITATRSAGPTATRSVRRPVRNYPREHPLAFVIGSSRPLSAEAIPRLYPSCLRMFAKSFVVADMNPDGRNLAASRATVSGSLHRDSRRACPDPGAFAGVGSWTGPLEHASRTSSLPTSRSGLDPGRRDTAGRGRVLIRPFASPRSSDRPRGCADAAEVDLFHPEAEDRLRAPAARLECVRAADPR